MIQMSLTPSPPPTTRTIAFTTPNNYATRLSSLIQHRNWVPLWFPTVIVEPTNSTLIHHHLTHLNHFSAIAFTSRSGISAFTSALSTTVSPPLSPSGHQFTLTALGKDSDLLTHQFLTKLCSNSDRLRVLIPPTSTPSGLVHSLGPGLGRRVLCPVPLVVGLEEPPVVPDFLRDLGLMGWTPVRADAYVTRWAGPECVRKLVNVGHLDAVVFTSSAEVEGLLKGLREIGLGWEEVRRKWPRIVVAAHGPVTASGAERLGVRVDVVSTKFGSFDGVLDALDRTWTKLEFY